jgi:hypothetical protein
MYSKPTPSCHSLRSAGSFRSSFLRISLCVLTVAFPSLSTFAAGLDFSASWKAPLKNVDGTTLGAPLTYNVFVGKSSGSYATRIAAGTALTARVTGLSTNTLYYFSVVAVDRNGKQSGYAAEVTVSTRDTDGDGLMDYVETGTGIFVSTNNTGTKYNVYDTDGDGKSDGAEVAAKTDPNSGTTTTTPPPTNTNTSPSTPTTTAKAVDYDFDGDRKADMVVYNAGGTWYPRASRTGTLLDGAAVKLGTKYTLPTTGDFDKDGKADVATVDPATGVWQIRKSSTQELIKVTWTSGCEPAPADYDGDGMTDIAVFRLSTGSWFVRWANGKKWSQSWGPAYGLPVPADYDGDGKADVAVYDVVTGAWSIRQSSNGAKRAEKLAVADGIAVPGDYDGDRKADVAVVDPATMTWHIQLSGSNKAIQKTVWGKTGELPAPADYDGDGKFDMAAYSKASGTWLVRPSSAPTKPTTTSWSYSYSYPLQAVLGGY